MHIGEIVEPVENKAIVKNDSATLLSQQAQKVKEQVQAAKQERPRASDQKATNTTKLMAKTRMQKSARRKSIGRDPAPPLADLSGAYAVAEAADASAGDSGEGLNQHDIHEDLNAGAELMLNTREFLYYNYLIKIKKSVQEHWEPNLRNRIRLNNSESRNIAQKNHVAKLLVIINSKGELVNIEILNQSDIEVLESTALEAFRKASPFPAPPKGLLDTNDTVTIRWDFSLEA
jgi:TonB family protein